MEDTKKQYSRICNLIDQLTERGTTTKTKLRRLEDRFHLILAAHALGEITDSELDDHRNKLRQLGETLKEIRLTIPGLEARQAEVMTHLKVVKLNQRVKEA